MGLRAAIAAERDAYENVAKASRELAEVSGNDDYRRMAEFVQTRIDDLTTLLTVQAKPKGENKR